MKKKILICFTLCFCLAAAVQAQEPSFYISTSYRNLLSNPEQSGMLDKILIEAFRRIGFEAKFVYTPTEKSLADVNAGLLDAELNRISGMEAMYPGMVRVPEPNMTMHFVAFSKEKFEIDGWESIRGLYTGIIRGWKILENNTEGFPLVTYVPSERELFTMLAKDRLDIALYSKITGYAALRDMGFDDIFHLEPPLASRDMFLYVHDSHAALADDIAAAIRSMKEDGTYRKIVEETISSYIRD